MSPTFSCSPDPDVKVLENDDHHVVLSQANILVALWYGPQEPRECRRLYDIAGELATKSGAGKVAALSILRNGATAPSPEAREALARLHEDPDQVIHRSAVVFAKTGFIASIVRSIIISLRQRTSRRDGHDVFSTTAEALTWVLQGLPSPRGTVISPDTLLSEIEQHDAHRAREVA